MLPVFLHVLMNPICLRFKYRTMLSLGTFLKIILIVLEQINQFVQFFVISCMKRLRLKLLENVRILRRSYVKT